MSQEIIDVEDRYATRNWREYLREFRESWRVYQWVFWELISADSRKWMKRMTIALVCGVGFITAQSWALRHVFDGVIRQDMPRLLIGFGFFLICLFGQAIAQHYQAIFREWALGLNMGQLDRRTSELFFGKSLGQHLNEGGVLSSANVEKGRGRVIELENMLLFEGLGVVISLMVSFLCLWFVSPVAGSLMTFLLLNYLFWLVYLNQRVNFVCGPIDAEFRRLNRHRVERWDMVERVKTMGKEQEEIDQMSEWFENAINRDRNFWIWFIRVTTLRGLVNYAVLFLVMAYGASQVWHGHWEAGLLYPLFSWSRYVSDNLWRIGQIEHQLNWNMPAVRSLKEALTLQPDISDGSEEISINGKGVRIEFDGVSHEYLGSTKDERDSSLRTEFSVLKNVSFSVEPGEKVALIGPSGAGKTTIMRLLFRAMDPSRGSIRVNGLDLRHIQIRSWLRYIGYIAQQPQVFEGTIASNLLYGVQSERQSQVTENDLWKVVKRLQIHFGKRLTHGLQTSVGRHGLKLSGGQAQRLMIGAAAAREPRFMIIDEATSSLDSTTERQVQQGLAEVLGEGMGALIIAHRLSTVRDLCGKFVVLRPIDGVQGEEAQIEAVASSFEELYLLSSTFRQLADDQGIHF